MTDSSRLQRIARVIAMRADGRTYAEIADSLGTSRSGVQRLEDSARIIEGRATEWAALQELITAARDGREREDT
jgi:transcriptional regulator